MPKTKFHQSGNFSTKSGKFSTSAECSNSCNSAKKIFFFCKFLKVENFPPKWKKFQIFPLGMKFGKREGLDAENKISPKWKVFHQKWKIFDLCRMFQFMQFCKKNFFFATFWKWKIFHQSGKISTLHLWTQIWQTRRSSCRKKKFTKVENFPPKVEKFPPLQNVPIHLILE